jgi:hypothetical protein
MAHEQSTAVAKDYYDSADANTFYMKIWGGENIHVGYYKDDWNIDTVTVNDVKEASIRIVDVFFSHIPNIESARKVADLGIHLIIS